MLQEAFNVDWLMQHGFSGDLLAMLLGENEYSDERSFNSIDEYSHRLRGGAIRHLEFRIRFGNICGPVNEGGRIFASCDEYFEAWKLAGCPGVSLFQLDRMLNDMQLRLQK